MIGRGTRIATGKQMCEVVDFSGTVKLMGAIETIRLVKEQQPEFQNPVWELYAGGNSIQHRWHNRLLYSYELAQKDTSARSFS